MRQGKLGGIHQLAQELTKEKLGFNVEAKIGKRSPGAGADETVLILQLK